MTLLLTDSSNLGSFEGISETVIGFRTSLNVGHLFSSFGTMHTSTIADEGIAAYSCLMIGSKLRLYSYVSVLIENVCSWLCAPETCSLCRWDPAYYVFSAVYTER